MMIIIIFLLIIDRLLFILNISEIWVIDINLLYHLLIILIIIIYNIQRTFLLLWYLIIWGLIILIFLITIILFIIIINIFIIIILPIRLDSKWNVPGFCFFITNLFILLILIRVIRKRSCQSLPLSPLLLQIDCFFCIPFVPTIFHIILLTIINLITKCKNLISSTVFSQKSLEHSDWSESLCFGYLLIVSRGPWEVSECRILNLSLQLWIICFPVG